MSFIDRQRIAAVRKLESDGFKYVNGEWTSVTAKPVDAQLNSNMKVRLTEWYNELNGSVLGPISSHTVWSRVKAILEEG